MPASFWPATVVWQPGGARGAPEPTTLPARILAIWKQADGTLRRGEMAILNSVDDLPSEVPWSSILQWTDLDKLT